VVRTGKGFVEEALRGGMIPDVPPREAYPPQRKLAGPLEDALERAMANKSLALGPGSYPALP